MKKILLSVLLFILLCGIGFAKNYKLEFVWDKNSETDLSGYDFYRGDPNFDTYKVILENIAKDANTCIIDANIVVGNAAYFAIVAFNDKGSRSGFSNIVPYTAENAAPVSNSQVITTKKNIPINILLVATDPDGDKIEYSILTQPLHGILTGTPPEITYNPKHDFAGLDNIVFRSNDGLLFSNTASIAITVKDTPPKNPCGLKILNCLPAI